MFIMFWSGFGFLVPVITLAFVGLGILLENSLSEATVAGLIYAGLAVSLWLTGRKLNSKAPRGVKRAHSFFFVAIEYWALLPGLLYLLMVRKDLLG